MYEHYDLKMKLKLAKTIATGNLTGHVTGACTSAAWCGYGAFMVNPIIGIPAAVSVIVNVVKAVQDKRDVDNINARIENLEES